MGWKTKSRHVALQIHLAADHDRIRLSCYLIQLLDADRVYLVVNICSNTRVKFWYGCLIIIHTKTGNIFSRSWLDM